MPRNQRYVGDFTGPLPGNSREPGFGPYDEDYDPRTPGPCTPCHNGAHEICDRGLCNCPVLHPQGSQE